MLECARWLTATMPKRDAAGVAMTTLQKCADSWRHFAEFGTRLLAREKRVVRPDAFCSIGTLNHRYHRHCINPTEKKQKALLSESPMRPVGQGVGTANIPSFLHLMGQQARARGYSPQHCHEGLYFPELLRITVNINDGGIQSAHVDSSTGNVRHQTGFHLL